MIGMIINTTGSSKGDTIIAKEDFLGNISVDWGLMTLPSIQLTLPSRYAKHLSGNSIVRVQEDDWKYEGYVESKEIDFNNNTVSINTVHILNRLAKRTMPTNVTLKNKSIQEVIEHTWNLWKNDENREKDIVTKFEFNFVDSYADLYRIEYEFSNETLVEFLTKVCEKSPDLYWRVSRYNPYKIDIGVFGVRKNVLISEYNKLVALNDITEDYADVVNVAVAMSDKADGGASSLTLRDIFYNPDLMNDAFPVIKTGNTVNSQRHYQYPQIPQFAPEIIGDEFAIMDNEGIAMESGEFYWGTIVDNDTQAIADDNQVITNEDRIQATKQLYQTAIRRLKNSRRKITYNVTIEPLEAKQAQVGDMVMFVLDSGVWELTNCSKYYEKITKSNSWYYITKITDNYEVGNAYTQELELSKFIYSERDTTVTT